MMFEMPCGAPLPPARLEIMNDTQARAISVATIRFPATLQSRPNGGVAIRMPFDPSVEWGDKKRHFVTGTIEGRGVRGTLTAVDGEHFLLLGPAWCRDPRVGPGAHVIVALMPEGPQFASLASDLREALGAEVDARGLFESLATFYRNGYVRWIDGAKRPETRAKRIEETVAALKAGKKQR